METTAANRPQVEFPAHERPHTDVNTMQLIGIGVALTAAIFAIAFVLRGTFIRDLLMGREDVLIERVIFQGAITFVWSCSVANVILKILKINQERACLDDSLVPEGTDFSDSERLIEIYDRIKSRPNLLSSLGLTRIARVMAMWINTGDFQTYLGVRARSV